MFFENIIPQSKFLVTGGAGFIGSHLVEYLLKKNALKVCILDNYSTGSYNNIANFSGYPNIEIQEGDITKMSDCVLACRGVDYVLHQAALGSVPRSIEYPMQTYEHNVLGFVNILEAVRLQGNIKRVVYASSSSVYGNNPALPKKEPITGAPLSPYALSKSVNEQYANLYAHCYGVPCIGLRYFNVFGEKQNPNSQYAAVIPLFIKNLYFKENVYINGDGMQTRDFTYINNVVLANMLALFSSNPKALNKAYNVAAGSQVSINQLFEDIANLLQTTQKPVYRPARVGDVPHSLASLELITEFLGYEPTVSFANGLQKTVQYFLQTFNKQ